MSGTMRTKRKIKKARKTKRIEPVPHLLLSL
jgi:hypothetical protein